MQTFKILTVQNFEDWSKKTFVFKTTFKKSEAFKGVFPSVCCITSGLVQGMITGIRGLCNGLGPALYGFIFFLFNVELSGITSIQPDYGIPLQTSTEVQLSVCLLHKKILKLV